ncbi:Microtubule-associated tumor suppressor candidate 2-like protein [Bienertia sinuspersici]
MENHMAGGVPKNLLISLWWDLLFWHLDQVTIHPIEYDQQYITMKIPRVGDIPWLFLTAYASLDPTKRQRLWEDLRQFASTHNQPWLLAGDINETRYCWERSSSCPETSRRVSEFLGNLKLGHEATQSKHQKVKHLPTVQSDHNPLLISPNGFAPISAPNKPFRFQAAWILETFMEEK